MDNDKTKHGYTEPERKEPIKKGISLEDAREYEEGIENIAFLGMFMFIGVMFLAYLMF